MNQKPKAESWSKTQHEIVKFTHEWTVENIKFYLDSVKRERPSIQSPNFFPINHEELQFYLVLFPKGQDEDSEDHASIFVHFYSSAKKETRIEIDISVWDPWTNIMKHSTSILGKSPGDGSGCGISKFIPQKELINLSGRPPKIFCDIKIITNQINTSSLNDLTKPSNSTTTTIVEARLLDNLSNLFENTKLSDFVLVTGIGTNKTTEHRAHKVILGAQSSVFQAMFQHDTKERNESRVEIPDIDAEVIKEMLRFMYSRKVQILDSLADQLLIAADKYALEQLKDACEKSIMENLTSINVVEMLVLADQHSAKKLRTKAIEYFNGNLLSIIETDGWRAIENEPKLYFEIFSKIIVENVKK